MRDHRTGSYRRGPRAARGSPWFKLTLGDRTLIRTQSAEAAATAWRQSADNHFSDEPLRLLCARELLLESRGRDPSSAGAPRDWDADLADRDSVMAARDRHAARGRAAAARRR